MSKHPINIIQEKRTQPFAGMKPFVGVMQHRPDLEPTHAVPKFVSGQRVKSETSGATLTIDMIIVHPEGAPCTYTVLGTDGKPTGREVPEEYLTAIDEADEESITIVGFSLEAARAQYTKAVTELHALGRLLGV